MDGSVRVASISSVLSIRPTTFAGAPAFASIARSCLAEWEEVFDGPPVSGIALFVRVDPTKATVIAIRVDGELQVNLLARCFGW